MDGFKGAIFEERKGSETSLNYETSRPVHGICVYNFSRLYSLWFTINDIVYPLEPGQGFKDAFSIPFSIVPVDNPHGCEFLIAGLV